MNTNELKELWASAENGIAPERARHLAAAALTQVNKERRRRKGVLAYIFVMIPLVTVGAAWQLFRHGTSWQEAWPAQLMLAVQWIAALYLLRIFRQGRTPPAEQPIRATLELLHAQVRSRCRELQTLLLLFLGVAPLSVIAIVQLQATGKMRPNEAASAGALLALILGSMASWMLYDLFARRLREKRYLETLLQDYQR